MCCYFGHELARWPGCWGCNPAAPISTFMVKGLSLIVMVMVMFTVMVKFMVMGYHWALWLCLWLGVIFDGYGYG